MSGFRLVSDFMEELRVWGMLVWENFILGYSASLTSQQVSYHLWEPESFLKLQVPEIGNRLLHQWMALDGSMGSTDLSSFFCDEDLQNI